MSLLFQRTYTDPDGALDDVRAVLRQSWPTSESDSGGHMPPSRTRHYLQLVLHEWLANLMRHATFSSVPRISVRVSLSETLARCEVADNSTGFDLEASLFEMQSNTLPLPESQMGLRIIDACATDVSYRSRPPAEYQFTASIPYDHDPWMNVLF
ncbi:MAG: ATP-binding protein [Longimonas sp.]|uniref:ATP-binding protein n=1 Tax=Longimonas sp. TaxID=2039626 RepID=UPI003351C538